MFVVHFEDSLADRIELVGAKGARLARMAAIGVPVPAGFCVTTTVYQALVNDPGVQELIRALDRVNPEDASAVHDAGAAVRAAIEARSLPGGAIRAIAAALDSCGPEHAYAVRASAPLEDLPHASSAVPMDSYLNVRGARDIADRVRACMASAFTDRAIVYRARHRIAHSAVAAAAVVERMIDARASGVLCTADPDSGHRHIAAITAGFGLTQAENPGASATDHIRVDRRTGHVIEYRVGQKRAAVRPCSRCGTETVELPAAQHSARVLSDRTARELTRLGQRIEDLFAQPQEVEWCMDDEHLYIVEARPFTSLFPLPLPLPQDSHVHVYYSWSHEQAMPEAMPPLVADLWRRLAVPEQPREHRGPPRVATAGGRVYVDVTPLAHRRRQQQRELERIAVADELAAGALGAFLGRAGGRPWATDAGGVPSGESMRVVTALLFADTRGVAKREAAWYLRYADDAIERIHARAGLEHRVRAAVDELRRARRDLAARDALFVAALRAQKGLMHLCPGRARDVQAAGKGLPEDVSTRMILALGDLADVARVNPEIAGALRERKSLGEIHAMPGGPAFCRAVDRFLDRYGFRGYAELDLSRPRWSEDPAPLLDTVRSNLDRSRKGEHHAHVRDLVLHARQAAHRLERRARRGVWGPTRSAVVRRLVQVMRAYLAIREHPGHAMARIQAEARAQLVAAGRALEADGRLASADDVWFLTVDELFAVLDQPGQPVRAPVAERRAVFEHHARMTAPRVLTSEGEAITAAVDQPGAPPGALVGTPVSSGVVEGRARVVHDPGAATIHKGDIAVARYCEPGWAPLYLNAAGMVMEAGGVMTPGSVVARGYGIPAVVAVDGATGRIRTGQRIRVDGWRGYVEIISEPDSASSP